MLTRRRDSALDILVATAWKSLASIGEFAGADPEAAVVADDAAALLSAFDRRVRHYELALLDRVG